MRNGQQGIEITSDKDTIVVSLSSFSVLKNLIITKKQAFFTARKASKLLNQELVIAKRNKPIVGIKNGRLKIKNIGLSLRALFA
jgi:hypothetical protein